MLIMGKNTPNILFIPSALGLGHTMRDLAIVKELRKLIPGVKVSWLAGAPASDILRGYNEFMLPESSVWPTEANVAEEVYNGHRLNLLHYLKNIYPTWGSHLKILQDILSKQPFDLVIGDETFFIANQINDAILESKPIINTPYIMIHDFIGVRAMTNDPSEINLCKITNDAYLKRFSIAIPTTIQPKLFSRVFVGNLEDVEISDTSQGLVDFKQLVKDKITFVGNVVRFNPENYFDQHSIKQKLGLPNSPLVVCSVGGTNVGEKLLQMCLESYKIISSRRSGVQMLLVCGPRIDPQRFEATEGVTVLGYVPNLHEYFAASDLVVIQPGYSTVMELIALRKPFIYSPVPEHFEQSEQSDRLESNKIGIKLLLTDASPEKLADTIIANLEAHVEYPMNNLNGASNAANYIQSVLSTTLQSQ
jgi:predicted glycosyltransferase